MRDSPYPTCAECGNRVRPETAVIYPSAKSIAERVLEGCYCKSDCVLDAIKRGYPKDRAKKA